LASSICFWTSLSLTLTSCSAASLSSHVEQLEHLVLERVVLLLALRLELRLGRLRLALGRLLRGLLLVGHAGRELRGVGHLRLGRAGRAALGLPGLGHRGDLHPVIERGLLDRLVADLDHGVAGDVAAARAERESGGNKKGAERQRAVLAEHGDETLGRLNSPA
jgi:hypothetical protein